MKKFREDVFITIYAGTYEVEAENREEANKMIEEKVENDYDDEDITSIQIG